MRGTRHTTDALAGLVIAPAGLETYTADGQGITPTLENDFLSMINRNFAALLTAAFSICAGIAIAGEPPPGLVAMCKTTLCRTPSTRLNLANGQEFVSTQPFALPVLQDGWISIFPGEEIFIEAAIENGQLALLRAVPRPANPDRTLVFKFYQKSAATDMFLEITNPFNVDLKFKLGMMLPDSAKLMGTSSCPVGAGLKLYEHWPHPIFQLLITRGRVMTKDEPRRCEL